MTRVVVGGSTGFIGRHLLQKYRAEGREVITISRSGADLEEALRTSIPA